MTRVPPVTQAAQTAQVGVNAMFLALGQYGGVETYARALMRELPALDKAVAYNIFTPPQAAGTWHTGGTVRETLCPLPPITNRKVQWAARLAYEYGVLPSRAVRRRCAVLFSPCFTAPTRTRYASVVTIHDMQHEDMPELFPWLDRTVFLTLLRRAARDAAHILTMSEYTRGRIIARYGIPPERITVGHNAASPAFFARVGPEEIARVRTKYGVTGRYLLSVATLHPHKNLDLLIDATKALRSQVSGEDVRLVLVGLNGTAADALAAKIRVVGGEAFITRTGYVSDADLPALYQGATACVTPSRYEGFGIPVLEAMASGVPVVTSNATALPEVAGDAALLFDPGDLAALVTALRRVLDDADLRAALVAKGTARVQQFTWRRTAEITLAVLRDAARTRKPGA